MWKNVVEPDSSI